MSAESPNHARRAVLLIGAFALVSMLIFGIGELGRNGGNRSPDAASDVSTNVGGGTDAGSATAESLPVEPTRIGLSGEQLAVIRPNELGIIPVLEYHLIEPGENRKFSRTPESVRADLEWLVANQYFPIRFRDLSSGDFDVPAGKKPVVLTFDDSSIGQFRFLDDGRVDPQSAMGVMLDIAEKNPEFPAVATFFPLLDVDVDSRILWGQPDSADKKLAMIIDLGGEVGGHTVSHERLDRADVDRIRWQLATSAGSLQDRIGVIDGEPYDIVSLALPLGMYPADESLLRSGSAEGRTYEYSGAAEVAGGPTASPFSSQFDAYHIDRTQAVDGYLDEVFAELNARPDLVFVSDGDPEVVTVPNEATLGAEQRDAFAPPADWPNERIIRYDRTP